jgi:flavin-dependent dehydrogenase
VLVGDAGYHRDPITGHGITDAFRDAELLARAAHDWLSRDPVSAAERSAMAAYRSSATTRSAACSGSPTC